jgi:hypothetical protein
LLVVDDGDGVGADQLAAGEADGGEQVGFGLERGFDEVGDAFGVGVGGEDVALGGQFAAQAFVVLDDAVVDNRDRAGNVLVAAEVVSSSATRPTERTRSMRSPEMTASPAES